MALALAISRKRFSVKSIKTGGLSSGSGKGTIWGPVLGAVLLFTLQEMIWARFIYLHQLLFGAIIVAVVLLMPRGILGVLQQKYNLPRTI